MQLNSKRRHMIDFIFPVALFFVFALSALIVIMIAVRIYQSSAENSFLNYSSRTSLSYISEKVHQNDADGEIYIGRFDGCDALVMEQSEDGDTYYSYIYEDDNELKELYVKAGANANADSGHKIMDVSEFTMEQVSDKLLRFTCTDKNDQKSSIIVGVKSN